MAQSSLSAALRSALILFVVNASSNVWAQNADDHQQEKDQQEAPSQLPHITIEGSPISGQFSRTLLQPEESHYTAADAARLLKRAPGANINNNGPLSSQVQYRGMFGPRVNVLVDGHHRAQGGPNWMDPPLHYLPSGLVDHIEITRGIASVSSGGETIGGTVKAFSKTSQFNEQDQWASHGSVVASFRSVDDAFNSAAIVTASNKNHRLHVLASVQDGDDIRAGRGTIAATEHERKHYGVGYGYRFGQHEIGVDYRHTDTGPTGTPTLPMDILFFDTDSLNLKYSGQWSQWETNASFFYSSIDHGMNNFSLRPPPDFNPMSPGPERRFVNAAAESFAYRFDAQSQWLGGLIKLGVDGDMSNHNMVIRDPGNPGFFVNQFNDIDQNRYGFFAEWQGHLNDLLIAEWGIRYNRVEMNAGPVDAAPARVLPPPMRLRDAFNTADRTHNDNNIDWVSKFRVPATDQLEFEFGAARKTRSPSYIERYVWLPVEASAGIADGNTYVGNLDLDPEVSHEFEFGFSWQGEHFSIAPRIFYKTVNDFIQGTAASNPDVIRVSTLNGDATPLQYTNVDAEFIGFDVDASYQFNAAWRADLVASYVRADRRDTDDPLYRITPPNLRLGLSYEQTQWSARAEMEAYGQGDRISETIVINEPRTSNEITNSYAIFHLYGEWKPMAGLTIAGGVENVFDNHYVNHLNGFNRVIDSDVGLFERIPGPGRNWFIRTQYQF